MKSSKHNSLKCTVATATQPGYCLSRWCMKLCSLVQLQNYVYGNSSLASSESAYEELTMETDDNQQELQDQG